METPPDITSASRVMDIFSRIGHLTRMLRDSLLNLGLEQTIIDAADAIPDARDRLNYVVGKTSQAANQVLSSVEQAQPLQAQLSEQAQQLTHRWDQWFLAPVALPEAKELVQETRAYLQQTPNLVRQTNDQLMAIMMAQDFQDLTGQVIQRMMTLIEVIEKELIQVLVENIPADSREKSASVSTLKNGLQVNPTSSGVVSSQAQVDDLLDTLGF